MTSPTTPPRRAALRTLMLLWVLGLCVLRPAAAIADPATVAARRDATRAYAAFLKKDFETFARYTYPELIRQLGGKEAFLATMNKAMTEAAAAGFGFVSVSVDDPGKIVRAGSQLHTMVPMMLVMKSPKGEMQVRSHLLGISADSGKTWTFLDTAKLSADNVKQILPNYNPDLPLPPKSEPTMIAK